MIELEDFGDELGLELALVRRSAPWFLRVEFERGLWCAWPRSVARG